LKIDDCPAELAVSIREFWPEDEWENAASVAELESGWNAFALHDTTTATAPCGTPMGLISGVQVVAERSVGYFQINACNYPAWTWQQFWNARHNAGTAHDLWSRRGWQPWYFSAKALGLT
jgi:hypothetical protein